MNVVAQILGFIAYFFIFFSYQKKEKKGFLKTQMCANAFFIAQYCVLGAMSALASSSISICRTLTYYKCEKEHRKPSVLLFLLFEGLIIGFGIFTYSGIYSLIPVFICCLYAYSTWQENLKLTYLVGIFTTTLWIYYNFKIGAYVSTAGSIFELFSSSLGFYKLCVKKEDKALVT